MGLDDSTDRDSRKTKPAGPALPSGIAPTPNGGEPTVTLSQRDRLQAETGLLFGLLALANGLLPQESLTRALGAWALEPGRSFREILVDRGHLDESGASLVDTLAERHLEQHHGIAWESLIALGKVVQFRLDPKEVADSELRIILGGFVAKGGDPPRPSKVGEGDGFRSRYQNIEHHASGGLGVVSRARDVEMCREVALKEIRPDCADNPDYRARFVREAEVTGRLEHPGIVPVYGIGHHDDGRPYYIMRFIRGETLKAAIGRLHKPRGEEEAGPADRPELHALVGRFIDACHAVAYAHHRKVLHRDLKPINIMLGPYGETLVVDWGLAKSFDGPRSDEFPVEEGTLRPESGSELTPTRVGSQVGTTGYMSPEQAAGRLLELGPTSDIYSLGVTLHYLATGHAPFEGSGKEEFLRRVREGDFPKPRKVNPSVPRPLEAICLKAMALRPIDRYQSAEALVEDLERWRAGQPVLAYPEPPIDRLARWAKRRKTALVGSAVLLVCSTAGLAVYAEVVREKNQGLEKANNATKAANVVANLERASAQAELMLTRDSLRMTLNGLSGPGLAYLANSGPPRLALANGMLELYRNLIVKHPKDPGVRVELAHACRVTANIGRSMGEFEPARGLYAEGIGLLEPLVTRSPSVDEFRINLARTRIDAGEHLRMAGSPVASEMELLRGLEDLKRPGGSRADDRFAQAEATALIDLAGARREAGRPHDAESAARRAVDLLDRLVASAVFGTDDRLLLIYALVARSAALRDVGDRDGAWSLLNDSARKAEELKADRDDSDTRFALAMVFNKRGRAFAEEGKPTDAVSSFDQANALLTELWDKNQRFLYLERELAVSRNGRGGSRLAAHHLRPDLKLVELALADCTKARESLEKAVDARPGHFDYQSQLGQTLANLGRIALVADNPRKARELLEQAISRLELACKLNPESIEDAKILGGLREELKRIGRAG